MNRRRPFITLLLIAGSAGVLVAAALGAPAQARVQAAPATSTDPANNGPVSWAVAGRDLANSRYQFREHTISPTTVAKLHPRWHVNFGPNLTSTPAVIGGVVYIADHGGGLWAFDATNGHTKWHTTVASYTGIQGDVGRATPAINNGRMIFGDLPPATVAHDGASIMAVNPADGSLLWRTVVDTNQKAKITGAPIIDGNTVYVGISSQDSTDPGCCTFRGSIVALNATTGAMLWKTYTVPVGYTGGASWGGSPVVDHLSGLIYVGTGENYSAPAGICIKPGEAATDGCTPPPPDDHIDSVLALNRMTGKIVWSIRGTDADVWTSSCSGTPQCGPDLDFGSAPNEFTTMINGQKRRLVGDGQKSGVYWAMDAYTGAVVWKTTVGPAPIQWGSATDNDRIYVGIENFVKRPYTLLNGTTIYGGAWSGLDSATGKILWQTPDPQGTGIGDLGFVSGANGVVFAPSGAGSGNNMYALDALTGKILWSFASGGSVMGGAAIVSGSVYWASGYYTEYCSNGATKCSTSHTLWAFDTT